MSLCKQGRRVLCHFTAAPSVVPQLREDAKRDQYQKVRLRVRQFFQSGTAVIFPRELAEPGELTQGPCSPWQERFSGMLMLLLGRFPSRLASATSSRPLHLLQSRRQPVFKKRCTQDYVPDDYADRG